MDTPLSIRQRCEQSMLAAIDTCSVWFIGRNFGVDKAGRTQGKIHALFNPFPGVDHALVFFTSYKKAVACLSRMNSQPHLYRTDGLRIMTLPGTNEEDRQFALLEVLDDMLLPGVILWDLDGTENQKDVPRCSRQALRRLILGNDKDWDSNPSGPRLI